MAKEETAQQSLQSGEGRLQALIRQEKRVQARIRKLGCESVDVNPGGKIGLYRVHSLVADAVEIHINARPHRELPEYLRSMMISILSTLWERGPDLLDDGYQANLRRAFREMSKVIREHRAEMLYR